MWVFLTIDKNILIGATLLNIWNIILRTEGRNIGAIIRSLFSTATVYILTEKVGWAAHNIFLHLLNVCTDELIQIFRLDLSNWTKCVASAFVFILPLILPIETYLFRVYAFLSLLFLKQIPGYSKGFGNNIFRYLRKKVVGYFLGIIDNRMTNYSDCIILFR